MGLAISLHVLAMMIWVGGMFFAHQCLRPVAAAQLPPPQRLPLWVGVFERFFVWVWISIATILATGLWMIFAFYSGFAGLPLYVHAMFGLGLIMMAIFMHVFFAPYKRLKRAVAAQDWPTGAANLNQIRTMVGINTLIGLVTIVIGAGGRYLMQYLSG